MIKNRPFLQRSKIKDKYDVVHIFAVLDNVMSKNNKKSPNKLISLTFISYTIMFLLFIFVLNLSTII